MIKHDRGLIGDTPECSRRDFLEAEYEELMFADGFDDAIIGVANIWRNNDRVDVVCYNLEKMIEKLVEDGMTYDEAYEYYEFNIAGAYMGELTPIYIEI